MGIESLSAELSKRPEKDLLRLYVDHMARKRTDFDPTEAAIDLNWANATMLRAYAGQLERRWEGFINGLERRGIRPDLPWSAPGETEDRPGPSDLARLKADLENLAVKLDTSHILNG